jgi:hypothetical protein
MAKDPSKRNALGTLSEARIAELMDRLVTPGHLASISPNGFPLVSTVWFLYEERSFWCIMQERTLLRRNLARNPRCAFEVAPAGGPYKLLRGQGTATLNLEDGERLTERMIARYLDDPHGAVAARMRAQVATEYAIRIQPRWVRPQGQV